MIHHTSIAWVNYFPFTGIQSVELLMTVLISLGFWIFQTVLSFWGFLVFGFQFQLRIIIFSK